MKSYTDIEQSRKLAEILPIESADMWWLYITSQGKRIAMMHEEPDPHYLARMESYGVKDAAIRCWSLAALLEVIRKAIGYTVYGANNVHISCELGDKPWEMETKAYDNEVDASYEMILKLNELKLL